MKCTAGLLAAAAAVAGVAAAPPNFVIVVADDMGVNDFSIGGAPTIQTPNLDKCGEQGALASVLRILRHPAALHFTAGDEVTIADSLKEAGYFTAAIGKWHLGSNPATNCTPTTQGFDYSYSILYSHEEGFPGPAPAADIFPPVPLTEMDAIVEQPVNLETLGDRIVTRTNQILDALTPRSGDADAVPVEPTGDDPGPLPADIPGLAPGKPFFLYLAPASTHVPLYAQQRFHGASLRGPYGDAAMQTDHALGAVMAKLSDMGALDNTLKPLDGGSNAPFRGGKGSTWEGGYREPAVLYAPPHILDPALVGTVDQHVVSAMDLLPTFRELAGLPAAPRNVTLDGVSWRRLLANNLTYTARVQADSWPATAPSLPRVDQYVAKAQAWAARHGTRHAGHIHAPGTAHRASATALDARRGVLPANGPSSGAAAALALLASLTGSTDGSASRADAAEAARSALVGARGRTLNAAELVQPYAVQAAADVKGPFSPAYYAPGGELGAAQAAGTLGAAPNSSTLHDWVWYWRDNVVYAARYGPFKAEFFTRAGFGWDAPTAHEPALLYNVETDPAEALPLNTTAAPYDAMVAFITNQAKAYAAQMLPQARPSRYLAMDWGLVPCCHKPYNATRAKEFWAEGEYGLSIYEECVCSDALTRPTA
ncbi:Arsa [Symbiodinium sp. KB8]|nr:Arsa [Symbiodinium sp. KB8]